MKKEEQLSFLDTPKPRGGARSGAGRPAKRGKTKVLRIPETYEVAILKLIEHLDNQRGRYNTVESECFTRDHDGRGIELKFTSRSR